MNLLRFTAAASLLVTLSALGAACSSKGEASAADGCAAYASAFVSYTKRCSTGSQSGYTDERWSEYQSRFTLVCGSALSLPGTGITGGVLSGCAEAMRDMPCGAKMSDIPACDFPAGTLADNAPCSSSDQCQSESCAKTATPTGSSSTCGTCSPRAAVGAACDSATTRCVSNAYCDAATKKCIAVTTSAVGGPCDSTKGQTCDSNGYCDYTTKICKARAKAGETCGVVPCQSGLSCDPTSKTCAAPIVATEGQACGGTTRATCTGGTTCDGATQKCVKIVWAKAGADCSAPFTRCERGSCDSTTKKCPTLIPDGGVCVATSTSAICNEFASCIDGKCMLPGQVVCK